MMPWKGLPTLGSGLWASVIKAMDGDGWMDGWMAGARESVTGQQNKARSSGRATKHTASFKLLTFAVSHQSRGT